MKPREVPLNATARQALQEYLPALTPAAACLFPSKKTGVALTARRRLHRPTVCDVRASPM